LAQRLPIPEEDLKKLYQERIKNFDPSPKYELEVLIVRDEGLLSEVEGLLKRGEGTEGSCLPLSREDFLMLRRPLRKKS
jgi:peptidyl-prolyl cis-trans isomerase SurA